VEMESKGVRDLRRSRGLRPTMLPGRGLLSLGGLVLVTSLWVMDEMVCVVLKGLVERRADAR
jgi:hypothetical protein